MRTAILTLALCLSPALASESVRGAKWVASANGHALFQGDKQVGFLDASGDYWPILGPGRWGEKDVPPLPPPAAFRKAAGQDFGLDPAKVKDAPAWSVNGRPVSKFEAIAAIEAGVPDDSTLPRLTFVSADPAARKRFRDDVAGSPALAAWRGSLLVQDYAPGDWAVAARGLAEGVTLQAPDGAVVAQSKTYEGADWLDRLLRREPSPSPSLPQAPFGLTWPVVILGGLAAFLLFRKDATK
jgi:hypothetical protein